MARPFAFLRVFFKVTDDPMDGVGMWTWNFWRQAGERAIKTAAQFVLVFVGADVFNALSVDYATVGGFALAGAGVSILTSLASEPFTERGTPSLVEHQP